MDNPIEKFENEGNVIKTNNISFQKYICEVCNHIYDEEDGEPMSGILPGTRWDAVPSDWRCPECAAVKKNFKLLE